MNQEKKEQIALQLFEIGSIKFGEFTLKSGIKSPIYIDLRILVSYPKLLNQIAEAMIEMAKSINFDCIAGIPYTALPIATAVSIQSGWPMIYSRKEVKKYGTKKQVEGVFKEGQTVLVIDDLITTGESKFETIEPFEASGLKINDFLIFLDRLQGGKERVESKGYKMHSLMTIFELLEILKKYQKITEEKYTEIKEFIKNN